MAEMANAPENSSTRVIGVPPQQTSRDVEQFAMQQYNAVLARLVKLEDRLLQLEQRVFL